MKIVFTILLFFISFIIEAQNLYLSSGFYVTGMSLSIDDPRQGYGTDDFKNFSGSIDFINILIETKMDKNSLSIKSGFYFNKEFCDYQLTSSDNNPGTVTWSWKSYDESIKIKCIKIPLLLSFNITNITNKEGRAKVHIDAGPYFGYNYRIKYAWEGPNSLASFDFGGEFLMGLGAKKWQFSWYLLAGFKNLAKQPNDFGYVKARGMISGFNLTRVLNLERKSVIN